MRNVHQHTIEHGGQGGDPLSDEFQPVIPPTSCPTLSRVLPSLPEGENLVEREVNTVKQVSQGDDRLSDESKPVILPTPAQIAQPLELPSPQMYSMNNGSSPMDVRSEVTADDSDVRGRGQPSQYHTT